MIVRSRDPSETGSIFASGEVAEQWRRGAAQRDHVNAPANEMMLDLANLRVGTRVLDVAAGTGDTTLMAARRVGPTGYILATDLSSSMLNVAAEAVPNAVIPSHVNEAATTGGKVNPGTKTKQFIHLVKGRPVHVPLSRKTMEFNSDAKCTAGC